MRDPLNIITPVYNEDADFLQRSCCSRFAEDPKDRAR